MGAIVAATLTAVGSAAIAAWQTRGLLREARVLESEWEVETGFRWPNARRDSAELGAPAPAGLLRRVRQRALAKFGVPTYPGPRAESQGATEVDDEYAGHEPMDWNEDSNSELSVYDRDECDAPANDFDDAPSDEAWKLPRRDKTPLDALRYAPFLLDAAPRAAWAILLGSLTLLALFGPQVTPGATQLSAVLIPLATLALASLYPLPWGWAMLAVGRKPRLLGGIRGRAESSNPTTRRSASPCIWRTPWLWR